MKRIVCCAPLLFFALISCTKMYDNPVIYTGEYYSLETKAENEKGDELYIVNECDLADYIKFRNLERKEIKDIKNITPVCRESGIPIIYVVNYEDGWEVVSADRRTAPRLAYSEEGELDLDNCPDTQQAWFESLISEVTILRKLSKEQLSDLNKESLDEMANNIEFWEAITASESFIQRIVGGAQKGNPEMGYYELDGAIVDTLEYEVVNHLMAVHWFQSAPYNSYCPLRTDNPNLRSPAGCGAIAMAQILWYLHNAFGYPEYAPDSATVTGDIDDYTMTQSGHSSTVWSSMFFNGERAAVLIANVGTMVEMEYGNTASTSYASKYRPFVFIPYGVDCTVYNSFNPSVVGDNLLNGLPVLISARTANNVGHAFVIDGYKAYHVGHGLRYIWVSTDPSPDPQTIIEPVLDVFYYYEDPFVREYSMNWGWGQAYDNGWYTTTGSWVAGSDAFDYYKKMIADFTDIE